MEDGQLLRINCRAHWLSAEQACGRPGLGVELVFQGLGSRKADLSRCLDGHGLASGRVPAFPCGAILDLELAKPVERDFLTLGRSLANPCEYRIDNLARVSLGDPLFGGDLFGKSQCCSWISSSCVEMRS